MKIRLHVSPVDADFETYDETTRSIALTPYIEEVVTGRGPEGATVDVRSVRRFAIRCRPPFEVFRIVCPDGKRSRTVTEIRWWRAI